MQEKRESSKIVTVVKELQKLKKKRENSGVMEKAVIVSQWTWAATLLQSSNVAWQYGVSGPFW